jgi:hypothetical protein
MRCENGHFYDGDVYVQCPHCGHQGRNDDLTVGLTQGFEEDTSLLSPQTESASLADAVQQTAGYSVGAVDNDATVGYYDQSLGAEPVVGWLVCIEGNNLGNDFRLKSGRNFIGRAQDMDVSIPGDDTVSREKHAIVVYEPKTYTFLVQAGDSKELSYLNDKVVLNPEELKANDIITVGNTKLMFFPCCNEKFNWEMVQQVS